MRDIYSHLAPYDFLSVTRIDAVRGSILPEVACELLTGKAEMRSRKGVIGCSLSHALAWEEIVRNGYSSVLVLEDDAKPHGIEILRDWQVPRGVDLVFCNSRLVYKSAGLELLPFFPALYFTMQNKTATGADGYIISNIGAQKLLSYFLIDGFYSHLDLRIAAYGLTIPEMEKLPQKQVIIRDICTLRRKCPRNHYLNIRVLGTSLTMHSRGARSSREAEDRLSSSPQ